MWTEVRGVTIAGGMAALLVGLAGCSSSTHGSTAAGTSTSASTNTARAGSAPEHPGTAHGVLADFVAAIVDKDYSRACLDMAAPTSSATNSPLKPATATQCSAGATASADGVSPLDSLRALHESFTPKNATGQAMVSVSGGDASGSNSPITIHANQIAVDGQSLLKVVVSHSTGVTTSNADLSFVMTMVGGAWYVSDMNIDI